MIRFLRRLLAPRLLRVPTGPYDARVVRVVDGDTIRCDVRVGDLYLASERLSVWAMDKPVRLAGCNAAEVRTEAGRAARDNLVGLLPVGALVTLTDVVDYKYGGELVAGVTLDGKDLIARLIAEGWLAPWDGRGPRPVPPWPRP